VTTHRPLSVFIVQALGERELLYHVLFNGRLMSKGPVTFMGGAK